MGWPHEEPLRRQAAGLLSAALVSVLLLCSYFLAILGPTLVRLMMVPSRWESACSALSASRSARSLLSFCCVKYSAHSAARRRRSSPHLFMTDFCSSSKVLCVGVMRVVSVLGQEWWGQQLGVVLDSPWLSPVPPSPWRSAGP